MAINLVISQVVGQAFIVKPDGTLVQAQPNAAIATGDVVSVPSGKNAWLVTEDQEQIDVLDEALLASNEGFDTLDLPSDVLDIIAAIEEGVDPTQKEGTETAAGEEATGSALASGAVIDYNDSRGGELTAGFDTAALLDAGLTQGQIDTLLGTRYGDGYTPPTFGDMDISSDEDGDIVLTMDDILGAITGGDKANISVVSIQSNVEGTVIVQNDDGSFTFTPPPNYNGEITFTIEVTDGQNTTTGNVNVDVAAVEDIPEITLTPVDLTEDENVNEGDVIAYITTNDGDGDALTVAIENDPNGYFRIEGNTVVLTEAGAAAIDDDLLDLREISVTVSVTDGKTTVEESVTLPITRTDDDATVEGDTTGTVTDGNGTVPASTTGTLTVSDPDSNNQTTLVDGTYKGEYGTLVVENGSWTYTVDKEAVAPLAEGEQASDVITISASDGSTHQITLNIEGTNDPALITGDLSATIIGSDGTMQATGTLFSDDVDGVNNSFIAETISTPRGELTINEDGSWSYVSTDPTGAVQALGEGDTLTETVTVRSADGTEQQIEITFQGVNDAATFSADNTADITEGEGVLSASGTIKVTDADTDESFMQTGTFDGSWGSVTMDESGNWTYTTSEGSNAAIQALGAGEKLVDTITVYSLDGTETQIVVTINGTNDAAEIGGDITGTVIDNSGTMTTSGTLTSTDIDGDNNAFIAETLPTLRGELTIDANGNWTYTTDDPTGAIQRLPEGETLTEVVTVRAEDGTEQQIVLTIEGVNDVPVFSAITARDVYESNEVISVDGTLNIVDPDLGESFMEAGTYLGDFGSVTIDRAGNWTYTSDPGQTAVLDALSEGEQRVDTVTVRSVDGTETEILVTIIGTNDPAQIAGDITGTVVEADGTISTSGTLTSTDVDGNDNAFTPQTIVGRWGELTIDAEGNWTYSSNDEKGAINRLGDGDQLTDTISVRAEDGTVQKITITIDGTNDAAVFGGMRDVTVNETDSQITASGRATVQDADYGEYFFQEGTFTGTYGEVTIDKAGNWNYTSSPEHTAAFDALDAGDVLPETVTVYSLDGTPLTIKITIQGTDDLPVVSGETGGSVSDVTTGETQTVSGSIAISDVDADDNPVFENTTITSDFGVLELVDGNWTYTLDPELAQYLDEGQTTTDTISITASDGTVHDITITITGSEDAAVLSGDTTGSVTDDAGSLTTSGSLSVSDPDTNDNPTLPDTNQQGQYGTFTMVDGNWTYTLDPELAAVLDEGVTVTDVITITDSMGGTHELTISVTGTDNAAELVGDTSGNLVEGTDLTTSGTIEVVDADAGDNPTIADTEIQSEYGTFTLVDGNWTYTLDNSVAQGLNAGQTATDTITLVDSNNNQHQVVITIEGTADAAVVSGDFTGAVTAETGPEVEVTNLFVWGDDADGDTATFGTDGQPGTLSFTSGGFSATISDSDGRLNNDGSQSISLGGASYPVSVNATVQYTDAYGNVFTMAVLTVAASEGGDFFGGTGETTTLLVQIDGPDIVPGTDLSLVDGSYQEVSSINYLDVSAPVTATGQISISDADTDDNPEFANVTLEGNYGTFELVDGTWTYTLDPAKAEALGEGEVVKETFTLTASDNTQQDIVIEVTGTDDSAVISGDLTGSVSDQDTSTSGTISITDPDGDPATIDNTIIEGQYGTFELVDGEWTYTVDPDRAQSLPEGQSANETFTLTASDGSQHEIVVTVTGTNQSAVVTGDTTGTVSDVDTSVSGTITVTDPDAGETASIANTTIDGQYGTFELVDGEWTYTVDPERAQSLPEGDEAKETFVLTASDGSQHEIVVTVTGTNQAAVVTGDTTGTVSDVDASVSGTITVSDPDAGETATIDNTTIDGQYGTFELVDGNWTYTVDPNKAQSLPDGEEAKETFVLTASDGSQHEVVVTVTGTNQSAVVTGDTTGAVTDVDTSVSGTITVTDPDAGETATIDNTTIDGQYGTFELVDGEWTYTVDPERAQSLPEGEEAKETFVLTASDGSQHEIVVTITGTNQSAVVTGDTTGTVSDVDTSVSGTITVTDPDAGEIASIANTTIDGQYGTFELVDGEWTYTVDPDRAQSLPEGEEAKETFTLTASDGSQHEIVVTVTGTNQSAVVTGDTTGTVSDVDTSVSGTITVTDPDAGETATIDNTTIEGQYGTFELVDGNWTYTVDPNKAQSLPEGQSANETFTLTASDGSQHEIVVTVTGTNQSAVVTGDTTGTVSDVDTSVSGTIAVTDPDAGETASIDNTTIDGQYGTFELVDGEWTYTVDPERAQSLPEGEEAKETFVLTASDGSQHEIVVTVTGTNQAAVVTGDTTGTVSDVETSVSGTITVTDPDAGETATIDNTTIDGQYGTFELVDGNWTYTVDPDRAESLPDGEEAKETFVITASDGSQHEVVVTVTGTDQAAVVSGDFTGTITTEDLSTITVGNAFIMDQNFSVDSGEFHTSNFPPSINFSGSAVSVEFNDNDARLDGDNLKNEYTNDASQTIVLDGVTYPANFDYTLNYTDAAGNVYTLAIVDVDTNADGNNYNAIPDNGKVLIQLDGPEITPDTVLTLVPDSYNNIDSLNYDDIGEPVTVSGTIGISDVDSDDSPSFANTTIDGTYGTLTLVDGEWTYTADREKLEALNADDTVKDVITLTATDGTVQNITITLSGTDDGSIISGEFSGAVTEDVGAQSVSGTITITDPDTNETPTIPDGTLVGAYGSVTLVNGNWTYTANASAIQSLGAGDVVKDTITVTASDGNQAEIVITLTGTDDAAVVTGDVSAQINEDATTQSVSGQISISDVDAEMAPVFANTTVNGTYGTLTLVDGAWTYTLNEAAQSLGAGESAQETLTLTATDGTVQNIVIDVTGSNDLSFISGNTTGSVTEGNPGDVITTSGSLTVSDADGDAVTIADSSQNGQYGSLSLVNGEWTYTLDNSRADSLNEGQQVSDTFTVSASDGSTREIVVNITGSDDAAVLSGTTTATISNFNATTQNVSLSRGYDGTWDVSDGNNLYLNLSNVNSDAAYHNSVGYYVLDASGNVIRSAIIFDNAHYTNGTSVNINTSGGEKVGLFMIPDGDSKGFNVGSVSLSFGGGGVTAYQGGAYGTAFVSESSKNGGMDYEYNSGSYSGWEDIVGGGDRDYNDVTFYVSATQQQTQPISASGYVYVSDVDSGDNPTLPNTTVQGEYGTLVLSNGYWTYTFDESNTQRIDNETLETIVVTDSEGNQHEIVIALQGTDDAPIVTGVFSGAVTEGDFGDTISVSGTISISDVDANDTPEFLNTTIEGDYGILTLTDGVWTYVLDDVKAEVLSSSDHVTDTITLTATDGTVQNINISISGTNDNPFVVGTNSASIVAPDSATQEYVDIANVFWMGDGYSFPSGDMQFIGSEPPTLNFHKEATTVRIYDTDSVMDGDGTDEQGTNEYVYDTTQKVEVNGVLYNVNFDYTIDYTDSAGNVYTFGVVDIDLDNDRWHDTDYNEQGNFIIQISGPTINAGTQLSYVPNSVSRHGSMNYQDLAVDHGALEAHGTLALADIDANDSQAVFADTTVAGQYGSLELVNGSWTYTLDPRSTPTLGDNDAITEVITLTATNGTQTQVNVTIGGSDAAVANANLAGVSSALSDVISLDDVTFMGSDANDRIAGSDSADVLLGNAGHDVIHGGGGADLIDGGLGDDLIFGGQGNDIMAGGMGSDTFAFLAGDQGTIEDPAVDHIVDFDAQQDAINLSDLLNNETADTLENYLSFSDDGEGHAILNISSQGDGNVDQQVVFDNMSIEDMASAYSVDISGMTSEQISTSVIDAMVLQNKMIID